MRKLEKEIGKEVTTGLPPPPREFSCFFLGGGGITLCTFNFYVLLEKLNWNFFYHSSIHFSCCTKGKSLMCHS